jgi:FKBP12-rapamycin complex-associated protein
LNAKEPAVRKAAAVCCTKLLVPAGEVNPTAGKQADVISEVVERLLVVGIADVDDEIRLHTLRGLDERFDLLLGRPGSLRSLFIALHDEVFGIRKAVMEIIGRLTRGSPTYVMPSLRQIIVQLSSQLEISEESRAKEESAFLLCELIKGAGQHVRPHVMPILEVLMHRLREPNPKEEVMIAVLTTLGELSKVGGAQLVPFLDQLLPQIVGMLEGTSSHRKLEVAIRTLGNVANSTGCVIAPYTEFPKLLGTLLSLLQNKDVPQSLRHEAMCCIGILGALDPYKKQIVEQEAISAGKMATNDVSSLQNGQMVHSFNFAIAPEAPPLAEEILPSSVGSHEDYFRLIAVNAFMRILLDPRTSTHYQMAVHAAMYILKGLRSDPLRCVPLMETIIPVFLHAAARKSADLELRKFIFKELCSIVENVQDHIQPHLDKLVALISMYWDENLEQMLQLMQSLANALQEKFVVYLPDLIPILIRVISNDLENPKRARTLVVLKTLLSLSSLLDGYLYLILPGILKVVEATDTTIDPEPRILALVTLCCFCQNLDLAEHASRIIHPMLRIIASSDSPPKLIQKAMEIICCMVYQLGQDYAVFIPMVHQYLLVGTRQQQQQQPSPNAVGLAYDTYMMLVSKVLKNQPLPAHLVKLLPSIAVENDSPPNASLDEAEFGGTLRVNQNTLKQIWEAGGNTTRGDWEEWMRRLSVELLRESPVPALRFGSKLAQVHQPLARELFNSAFVAVWPELHPEFQDELIGSIEHALQSPNLPPEILQTLLNLAEFMDHDDCPLPIDIRMLGKLATDCRAFAKALNYKELEVRRTADRPKEEGVEALIELNNKLNQPEAALGMLIYAQKNMKSVKVKASWYLELERWDDALEAYSTGQDESAALEEQNYEVILGKMHCFQALGKWEELHTLARKIWDGFVTKMEIMEEKRQELKRTMSMATASNAEQTEQVVEIPAKVRRQISSLGMRAAWQLQEWDAIDVYVEGECEAVDEPFFRAVLAVHRNEFDEATQHINSARKVLAPRLASLVSESYDRAYHDIVKVQELTELDEIVAFKQTQQRSSPDAQAFKLMLQTKWETRMSGMESSIVNWQRLITLHSLVASPSEDMKAWLKFGSMLRRNKRFEFSLQTLNCLKLDNVLQSAGGENGGGSVQAVRFEHFCGDSDSSADMPHPRVMFAYIEHQWSMGHSVGAMKELIPGAMDQLSALTTRLDSVMHTDKDLRVRCHLKEAEWLLARREEQVGDVGDDDSADTFKKVLGSLQVATVLDPASYKAWHSLAMVNFQAAEALRKPDLFAHAVRGFFRSVSVCPRSQQSKTLQDVLRLLTVWFQNGHRPDVYEAVKEGIAEVSVDTWLDVLPQLIARLHTDTPSTNALLHDLLTRVGEKHPQALLYTLTVASKSSLEPRRKAASRLMAEMRNINSRLVSEAELVSNELIRAAILWYEMWHEALEQSSKLFFEDKNYDAMLRAVLPLHEMLAKSTEDKANATIREVCFHQSFGRDLQEAYEWVQQYQQGQDAACLHQAWELYYQVFRRIGTMNKQLNALDLEVRVSSLLCVFCALN